MGVEVPSGGAAATEDNKSTPMTTTKKGVLIAGFLTVVLAAVLIGVLPDWNKDEKQNLVKGSDGDVVDDGTTTRGSSFKTSYLNSTSGPFNVSLPLFSPNVVEGYASLEDAKPDLKEMLKFMLNGDITNNKAAFQRGNGFDGDVAFDDGANFAMPVSAPIGGDAAEESLSAAADGVSAVGDDQTDFETNNQEEKVDRSDTTKSNGSHLFTAYGDHLLVINVRTGEIETDLQMDPIPKPEVNCDYPRPEPYIGIVEEDPDVMVDTPAEDGEATSGGAAGEAAPAEPAVSAKSMIIDPCWYQPTPYIQTVILDGNRLTLVVTGYGNQYFTGFADTSETSPVLYDYLGTRLIVYEINGGQLDLVTSKDVHGSYREAFTVTDESGKSSTHIVLQQSWNYYPWLAMPLQRWNVEFEGMTDDQYEEAAVVKAEALVDDFTDKIVEEIGAMGVDVNLVKISLFAESVPEDIDQYDVPIWHGGFPEAFTYIVSFDAEAASKDDEELGVSVSGVTMPSSWGYVYANKNTLWVAGQGWNWNPFRAASGDTTYLVGFDINGATSKARAVGTVDGYLLNPYSLDFEADKLRVATTQRFWTFPIRGVPVDDAVEPVDTIVWDGAVEATAEEEDDDDDDDDINTTLNQLIVFDVPATGGSEPVQLEKIGSVELGKKHEVFTTVRFFSDVAYAATFEQKDPFYVIMFKDDGAPEVKGELDDIAGFSSYLHPVNSNNTKLIAVGQYADDEGFALGIQISLFDATDPVNPKLIANHIEEKDENTYSSSDAQWEYKSVRYLRIDDDRGRLIMPLTIWVWDPIFFEPEFIDEDQAGDVDPVEVTEPVMMQEDTAASASNVVSPRSGNFDGFVVFAVENNKIYRQFYISHDDQTVKYTEGCWSCGWLEARSFVFSGDVVTMKGQLIHRTDLDIQDGEAPVWTTNIVRDAGIECCGQ